MEMKKEINTLVNSKIMKNSMDLLFSRQLEGYRVIQNKSGILIAIVSIQFPIIFNLFEKTSECLFNLLFIPLILLIVSLIISIIIVRSYKVDAGLSPEILSEFQEELNEEEFLDKISSGYWTSYNENEETLEKLGYYFNTATTLLISSVIINAIIYTISLYVG
jgi:hypothetical protein